MAGASLAINVERSRAGDRQASPDEVAVEEPLEIRLGYATPEGRTAQSLSITMRTPGQDRELAAGFLVGESIVRESADILSIEPCGLPAPDSGNINTVRVELADHVEFDAGRLMRHFYTTSSCGVCGKASLDALKSANVEAVDPVEPKFSESVLVTIPDKLREAQATFETTGGLHAAAAFTPDGRLLATCEDVGRHNALDKVIGSLLLDDKLREPLGIMVSGRASFELVQKALTAGMPLLAAVSAPSSLAVTLADEFGMTLVGFLRGDSFNIYTGAARLEP